jgi:predicted transcriptional regulator of viral defense system
MQKLTHSLHILTLAGRNGFIRPNDLNVSGIPRAYLTRMVQSGKLEKTERGIYQVPGRSHSENLGMQIIATKSPKAIFSLMTALQFHGLTTQLPRQVWITLPQGGRPPKVDYPPIKVIRSNKIAFEDGVEVHKDIHGSQFRVYGVARTVVDCFKHRNKIGLDVAIEALREALSKKLVTPNDLWHFAKTARVTNIIRPYIEALL